MRLLQGSWVALLIALWVAWAGCGPSTPEATGRGTESPPAEAPEPEASNRSVVRVNVTSQVYDFSRPWLKRAPFSRSALGVVLENRRVLVTAELVANHNVIELEMAETGRKAPAALIAVDYQSNLALVEAKDEVFASELRPIPVTVRGKPGDRIQIWQLENNGLLVRTDGTITTVALDGYPDETSYLMTYRVAVSLQYRDSSFVVPVMFNGALAGLLTRYDTKTQSGQAIPGPIIEAFLQRMDTLPEPIFPYIALRYAMMRDPGLRAHAALPEEKTGVYVTDVAAGSWADAAGIRRGDVILAIDGREIDQDGSYTDPEYGKLELEHLLSGGAQVGQIRTVTLWRDGQQTEVQATLSGKKASDFVSPPFVADEAPDYELLGGLVFQELSRQFLKQWGQNWRTSAPQKLVYLDEFQGELFQGEPRRIVFLGQVLPSNGTLGLEGLGHLVVTKINGVDVRSLDDVRRAVLNPIGGFHKVEFDQSPRKIFLDADEVKAEEAEIRRAFRIPERKMGRP